MAVSRYQKMRKATDGKTSIMIPMVALLWDMNTYSRYNNELKMNPRVLAFLI